VRASVNDAMKTLRADLASAAQDARADSRETGRSVRVEPQRLIAANQLRDAELLINEFRHQLRTDLRSMSSRGMLPDDLNARLRQQLAAVRASIIS
jgi:hypothetical protein